MTDRAPNSGSNRGRLRGLLAGSALAVAIVTAAGSWLLTGGFDEAVSQRVDGPGHQVVCVALADALVGFDVSPDVLVVDTGTHLVLEVVNDAKGIHDLAADSAPGTRRMRSGESQRLDLGAVTQERSLSCTLPGHASAGMTLRVSIAPEAAVG